MILSAIKNKLFIAYSLSRFTTIDNDGIISTASTHEYNTLDSIKIKKVCYQMI